ncbi:MAG TPA: VWA domain-containing protein [Bacteroidales bacterium]|nr:VWA domain-containing protein [Bacteroidales bacterium]
MDITFAYRPVLLLLLIIPLLVAWYVWKHKTHMPDIRFAHSFFIDGVKKSFRLRLLHIPFALRLLAMALLILALARPQSTLSTKDVEIEGIDIMIALDISGSMLAADFKPNRMIAAKQAAIDFIRKRPNDRIGMTLFSGESFTLSPLTIDHQMVTELVSNVSTGMVEDGTAIGDGLSTSLNRLRESQAASRVVILLTDGINNAGVIDPVTAAEIASIYGIRVYTVGVGSKGLVPFPIETPFGIEYRQVEMPIDEELLTQIAETTGGRYFWAGTMDKLQQVYAEIDQMERSKIHVTEYAINRDEFLPLVILALILIGIELLLRNTLLRTNP